MDGAFERRRLYLAGVKRISSEIILLSQTEWKSRGSGRGLKVVLRERWEDVLVERPCHLTRSNQKKKG